jgi:hypothetical protein
MPESLPLAEHDDPAALRRRVAQLEQALETRVAIEQAKGVLAERYRFGVEDAFALLRLAARGARVRLRDLAREVVELPQTPTAIRVALAGDERWRAAHQRELAGALREEAAASRERAARLIEKAQTFRPGQA